MKFQSWNNFESQNLKRDFMSTKIVKKIGLISLILSNMCTAGPDVLSKDDDSESLFLHGFYLGATASATSNTLNDQLNFDPNEVQDASLYARNQNATVAQIQPGFLIGYEYMLKQTWLISGEFQANFLNSFVSLGTSDYISNVLAANDQYALQVRGGFGLSEQDNIIYGLVGVARSQVGVNTVFNNTEFNTGVLGVFQFDPMNTTHTLTGLKLGLGYQKRLTHCLSLRIDYSHTQYGSFNIDLNDPVFNDILPGPLGIRTIKRSTDMLGLTIMAQR